MGAVTATGFSVTVPLLFTVSTLSVVVVPGVVAEVIPKVRLLALLVAPETVTPVEKVFAPAIVCVPVVITPPKDDEAGCKLNTPLVILAPLAFGEDPIVPKELTPLTLERITLPEASTVRYLSVAVLGVVEEVIPSVKLLV